MFRPLVQPLGGISRVVGLSRVRSGSILSSQVDGDFDTPRQIKRVLVSVFDKSGIEPLCRFLSGPTVGAEIISTGGTATLLREAGIPVTDVSEVTGSAEILGGRVKSLHPKIHGGILAIRGNPDHATDLEQEDIPEIDMVVGNLYPFQEAADASDDFWTVAENIDIGGPTMIRAAAKNHGSVAVVTSPDQYDDVVEALGSETNDSPIGALGLSFRRQLARDAFSLTARYEQSVASFFNDDDDKTTQVTAYETVLPLKYGNNPHQNPAALCSINGKPLPFTVVNGTPGYINLLDAINAWQLVREAREALGLRSMTAYRMPRSSTFINVFIFVLIDLPCAASFKHVSPAGAAVAVPLSPEEELAYEVGTRKLTPVATAFV